MKHTRSLISLSLALALSASHAVAAGNKAYEVTITNLTANNLLSPTVIATHEKGFKVYTIGEPASHGLASLAEFGGRFQVLIDELSANDQIFDIALIRPADTPFNAIPPGTSQTTTVQLDSDHKHISLVAMVAPTNDAFVAVNGIRGPSKGKSKTLYLDAYDAGSEANTERCETLSPPNLDDPFSTPMHYTMCIRTDDGQPAITPPAAGPEVPGFPAKAPYEPEGFVHVHRGIKGIGDLHPAVYDWGNPVAKVTIKRVELED